MRYINPRYKETDRQTSDIFYAGSAQLPLSPKIAFARFGKRTLGPGENRCSSFSVLAAPLSRLRVLAWAERGRVIAPSPVERPF